MMEIVDKFEKIVYAVLMILLMFVLLLALLDLGYALYLSLSNDPVLLLDSKEMVHVLAAFLLILIGVELLDTIKAYFSENTIHVEIVILLAVIATARKVILLDPNQANSLELFGIGVLVLGLAGGYFLIKKAGTATLYVGNEKPPA